MGGNSSNTLTVVPFIKSTIKCSIIHEESETLNRFLLAALEDEILTFKVFLPFLACLY